MKDLAIGIDVGGTSIKGGAVTKEGKVLGYFKMPIDKTKTQEETLNEMISIVNNYVKENNYKDRIIGIGAGIPGSIDRDSGRIIYCGNLGWKDMDFCKIMKEKTGFDTKIINDANAATYGEAKFGAGKNYPFSLLFTLGTGIGGGVIINGELYEGNEGKGTEMGHLILEMNGRPCTCGRKGCWEKYASATALIYDTKIAMEKDPNSLLHKIAIEDGEVNGKTAFDAAKAGDLTANKVIDNYVMYLCEGLLTYCDIFRPNVIILSGGIANQGDYLFDKVNAYLKKEHYGYPGTPKVDVIPAELGYDSGKIGAAALFF